MSDGGNERKQQVIESLKSIASAHEVSPHDVALRFMMQAGTCPIPRAANPDHIAGNLKVFDWELLSDEMDALW
jgi:2,5-diketo-D-gluconate reductase A